MSYDEGVFTATMSYHTMLKRAQAMNPVTTYVVCKLLCDAAKQKSEDKSLFITSENVGEAHPFYNLFNNLDHVKHLCEEIFGDEIIYYGGPYGFGGDDRHFSLRAYKVFVEWLWDLKLTFDDKTMSVTIPT